jgi:hypothetical protein
VSNVVHPRAATAPPDLVYLAISPIDACVILAEHGREVLIRQLRGAVATMAPGWTPLRTDPPVLWEIVPRGGWGDR